MSKRGLLAAGLLGLCAIVAATSSTAAVRGAAIDVGKTVLLAPRTKASGCRLGANPDRACSPGAYYSKLTKRVICAQAFRTGDVRNVPQSEKFAVEREYGLEPRLYGRTLEIDHIVSLELGGSNDIANLLTTTCSPRQPVRTPHHPHVIVQFCSKEAACGLLPSPHVTQAESAHGSEVRALVGPAAPRGGGCRSRRPGAFVVR
jgi:hypothetical protein